MGRRWLGSAMAGAAQAIVPQLPFATPSPVEVRWFCPWGCVVDRAGECEVVIGGTLVGRYHQDDRERGPRNVWMVTLAEEPSMHFGHLAAAFGVGDEYLRVLRRKAEAGGLGAVLLRKARARLSKVTEVQRRELRTWFADGVNPSEAFRRQRRRRDRLSRATISRERVRWQREENATRTIAALEVAMTTGNAAKPESTASAPPTEAFTAQLALFIQPTSNDDQRIAGGGSAVDEGGESGEEGSHTAPIVAANGPEAAQTHAEVVDGGTGAAVGAKDDAIISTDRDREADAADDEGSIVAMRTRPVASRRLVQHVGTWLLMALAQRDGLHDEVAACSGRSDGARVAVDATIAALAIGERCVEGVRRLQTPTVTDLLRVDRAPTASGVRRRLHKLADMGGTALVAAMSQRYIAAARTTAAAPAVFYIDNHLRPYSGQEVVRKGWRMQDRRVLPGTSDYYVHDEDGRPVFRVDVPSHDSLAQWLMPIAKRLRAGLGPGVRILLAFDRGGAYADQLAALRDADFEFVTYERKPYPALPGSAFERAILIRGDEYRVHESRLKNLGNGRGRLRRIALLSGDGAQINVVANSKLPLEQLIEILAGGENEKAPSGRWQQENAFKHGVERWGLNQLDGRAVEAYPPDTIIPNPARRRLEHALRLARAEEGTARCALANIAADHPRRNRLELDLHEAITRRVELELLRPFLPKHAALAETELAGKLVRHTGELKAVVDTIRIVCANVEADLAAEISGRLPRRARAEAKKVIANLFAAPGRVDVTTDAIRVRLAPAANRSERVALDQLFAEINRWNLSLPGDARRRPLRFGLQSA